MYSLETNPEHEGCLICKVWCLCGCAQCDLCYAAKQVFGSSGVEGSGRGLV